MAKYRKIVEAEQWIPGKESSYVRLSELGKPFVTTIQNQEVAINTGEWIIEEGDGVHAYPCEPKVFNKIYEPVKNGT